MTVSFVNFVKCFKWSSTFSNWYGSVLQKVTEKEDWLRLWSERASTGVAMSALNCFVQMGLNYEHWSPQRWQNFFQGNLSNFRSWCEKDRTTKDVTTEMSFLHLICWQRWSHSVNMQALGFLSAVIFSVWLNHSCRNAIFLSVKNKIPVSLIFCLKHVQLHIIATLFSLPNARRYFCGKSQKQRSEFDHLYNSTGQQAPSEKVLLKLVRVRDVNSR